MTKGQKEIKVIQKESTVYTIEDQKNDLLGILDDPEDVDEFVEMLEKQDELIKNHKITQSIYVTCQKLLNLPGYLFIEGDKVTATIDRAVKKLSYDGPFLIEIKKAEIGGIYQYNALHHKFYHQDIISQFLVGWLSNELLVKALIANHEKKAVQIPLELDALNSQLALKPVNSIIKHYVPKNGFVQKLYEKILDNMETDLLKTAPKVDLSKIAIEIAKEFAKRGIDLAFSSDEEALNMKHRFVNENEDIPDLPEFTYTQTAKYYNDLLELSIKKWIMADSEIDDPKKISKVVKKYLDIFRQDKCENELLVEQLNNAEIDYRICELYAEVKKTFKSTKDGYNIDSHGHQLMCEHRREYYDNYCSKNRSQDKINDIFNKYGETRRYKKYCKICNEELINTRNAVAVEIFRAGEKIEYSNIELELRKKIWIAAMNAINYVIFKGFISDDFKRQLGGVIATNVIAPIGINLAAIRKQKTITSEEYDKYEKFLTYLYSVAMLAQIMRKNSEYMKFKGIEFGAKYKKIFEKSYDLALMLLRGEIATIEHMTPEKVKVLLVNAAEKVDKYSVTVEKERTVFDPLDTFSYVYYQNMNPSAKIPDKSEFPFNMPQIKTPTTLYERCYNRYVEYISRKDHQIYEVTIEKVDAQYMINVLQLDSLKNHEADFGQLNDEEYKLINEKLDNTAFMFSYTVFGDVRKFINYGEKTLALKFGYMGSDKKVHEHIWGSGIVNGKKKTLHQVDYEEAIDDEICDICGVKFSEAIKKFSDIKPAILTHNKKEAIIEFFARYCPETKYLHEFDDAGICKKCKFGKIDKGDYIKKYSKEYEKANEDTFQISIAKYNAPPPKDAKVKAAKPDYYSVDLTKGQYITFWENIGLFENRQFDAVIDGTDKDKSLLETAPETAARIVSSYIYDLGTLVNKVINYDILLDKEAEPFVKFTKEMIKINEKFKKYKEVIVDHMVNPDYSNIKNMLVDLFNSLPKPMGQHFAKKLIEFEKSNAAVNLATLADKMVGYEHFNAAAEDHSVTEMYDVDEDLMDELNPYDGMDYEPDDNLDYD